MPVEVATYLLNEKRDWVQSLETKNDTQVIMVANSALETPHYQIRRVRDDQLDLPENMGNSYTLMDEEEQIVPEVVQGRKPVELAAIATVVPPTPAPPKKVRKQKSGPSLWEKIKQLFSGGSKAKGAGKPRSGRKPSKRDNDGRRRGGQRARGRKEGQRSSEKRSNENRNEPRSKQSAKKRNKKPSDEKQQAKARDTAGQNNSADAADKPSAEQDEARNDGRKTGNKRRSRGGRRRRRGSESAEAATTATEPTTGGQQTQDDSKSGNIAKAGAGRPQSDENVTEATASIQAEQKPDRVAEAAPEAAPSAKAHEEVAATPESKRDADSISVDDTQPELPVLKPSGEPVMAAAAPKAEPVPTPVEPARPVEDPQQEAATEKPTESKPAESTNGSDRSSAAPVTENAAPETRADGTAKGRLMPWEPDDSPPAAEMPEKETKSADATIDSDAHAVVDAQAVVNEPMVPEKSKIPEPAALPNVAPSEPGDKASEA